jgi:hypothetical protein
MIFIREVTEVQKFHSHPESSSRYWHWARFAIHMAMKKTLMNFANMLDEVMVCFLSQRTF